MMDKETWEFINSFAPWLSALGTIAAVITSLYLARRGDRITLKVTLGIRQVAVQGGGPEHGRELVWLNVTNLGRRAATITQLYWRPAPWRKRGAIWLAPQNVYSSPFPITLVDGQTANYTLLVEEFCANFGDYAREVFSGIRGVLRLRMLRIYVYTSTGDAFKQKPEKPLKKLFRTLAEEPRKSKSKAA